MDRFDSLIHAAMTQPFEGWDFSFLDDRTRDDPIPWDYPALARARAAASRSLLDMGTGGGELLASLAPFTGRVFASEGYPPNFQVAARRLLPLGVGVTAVPQGEDRLPFRSGVFDLVLNRHESYSPPELGRILSPGGLFFTQQVGGQDNLALNQALQGSAALLYAGWSCADAAVELERAGFDIIRQSEAFPAVDFLDIAAVVFYLRVIAWQIPDFSVERYRGRLFDLHRQIERDGGFRSFSHRFLIEARNPR